jgi:hypothetical protein
MSFQEPRMSKIVGHKSWRQPMHCWGSSGNHMCRDLPQIGDKERTMHIVPKATTVDDMGINVPRIYVALDDKQDDFHSHMIEVEGKINDQPIAILIDSGARHIYLDLKMVERFHFPRSNLGKSWLV